jgi:hypothetical protein
MARQLPIATPAIWFQIRRAELQNKLKNLLFINHLETPSVCNLQRYGCNRWGEVE